MLHQKVEMPEAVRFILRILNESGFEAYIVGGCVRDVLLGRSPEDWDITTSARPHEVKFLFSKTIDTGIKHGTVTVLINDAGFEVTTYRIEDEYINNRHPSAVKFTSSIKEDLSRRDFTVNAIAYCPDVGFFDPYCGMADLQKSLIRSVGQASLRFEEDALRMLRAIRFSAQLDFRIEESTFKGIRKSRHLIRNISRERIRDEMSKILTSNNPREFRLLKDTGLLKELLPAVDECFDRSLQDGEFKVDEGEHIIKAAEAIRGDEALRWTMLLHHVQGVTPREILREYRFDSKTITRVSILVENLALPLEEDGKTIRHAIHRVGVDLFPDLLKAHEAHVRASNPEFAHGRLQSLHNIEGIYQEIVANGQCTGLKGLAINGRDLISMGLKPGEGLRHVLEALLEQVLEDPTQNTKDNLERIVRTRWLTAIRA